MSQTESSQSPAEELTPADLDRLGARPQHRSDPPHIGAYRVLARLGGGGMGRLYLARLETQEGEYTARSLVAVKVIRPEYAEDERFRRRFNREVATVRRVQGTHTAALLDSGFDDEERLWMATAYVPGLSLADAVGRVGPLPAPVVWRLAHEVGQALTAFSAAGIVHRDLKPSNVLLGADGARVIDFGVAHAADTSALTMTGQHVGTPAYMSPEQADGHAVGTASDVFSLGSVLALAVTGTAPFGEGSTGDVIHRVIYSPPSEQVLAEVAERDASLADLVNRCLDKDAELRPSPQDIVNAAREHTLAKSWPEPVAEVIASRDSWSGRALVVPPMDQPTVLRRPEPERSERRATAKSRRPLVIAAAAALAAVAAVIAFVVPGHQAAPRDTLAGQHSSVTASSPSHPTPTHTASRPSKPSVGTTVTVVPQAPIPQGGSGGGDGGGGATTPTTAPSQAPLPRPTRTVTATAKPPSSKPWKSCTYYSGTALTVYGQRNNRVVELQCILKARGYDIGSHGVDGDFGPDTLTAVKKFQKNHGLRVDGEVGVNTWGALRG
ncbi:serine/threonine-protein kinase [Streptomyces sp. NPDC001980]|uniref:serine/threonine-protein kinase n=1 Tax=Streptomyces sp. NPDC001980 TaxID=3157126 RepID=UPI0033338CC1